MNLMKSIVLVLLFVACTTQQPKDQVAKASAGAKQVVVTYHPVATQIGYEILKNGGNAFDSFVASTAAEYVLGEGVTSIAGPLSAVLYDAKTKTRMVLDAGFNQPFDTRQKWDATLGRPGGAVLVPGAVAGLEAISKKYGKLPFGEVLKPAIQLAEEGFPLSDLYAALIRNPEYGKNLKRSDYGLRTYFKNGEPLTAGEILKLPEMAQFLRKLAENGISYVYRGEWAKDCLKIVNSEGGHLSLKDFSSYQVQWQRPLVVTYHGYEIAGPQDAGGINTALALKILERVDLLKYGTHYSKSADALEILIRIKNEIDHESMLYGDEKIEDSEFVTSLFSQDHTDQIWKRVQEKNSPIESKDSGSHSYHIVVIDHEGNAVTGTNTIEGLPWGKGVFVHGIPLTSSGMLPFKSKGGHRRTNFTSMQLGFEGGDLKFAAGAFSFSLTDAEFQFIINLIDYHLSAQESAESPRFGNQSWDIASPGFERTGARWMDPRIGSEIVSTLATRGLQSTQVGYVDTGYGAIAKVIKDKNVEGALVPLSTNGTKLDHRAGIGAGLAELPEHQIVINKVFPNSPAEKAGLLVGNIIISVRSIESGKAVQVRGMSVEKVINLVKGQKGTKVILEVQRTSGKIESVEIIRDSLPSEKR